MHRHHRSEDLLAQQPIAGVGRLHEGGLDEVSGLPVRPPSRHHPRVLSRVGDVLRDLVERLLVDHRSHEIPEVGHVSHPDVLHDRDRAVADVVPDRLRHVGPAGRRAFLALVLEGAAGDGHREGLRIGRGMGDDEVLAPGLPDDARVRAVAAHVLADGPPHRVEDLGGAGEVDAGQVPVGEQGVGHGHRVAGHEVDDPGREARRLEQPQGVVGARDRGGGRLPDHGVAHERGGGREVRPDGGEVERRDGVDEALERAVLELVPHAAVGDRLLPVELLRVGRVEAPEIDDLAGGVDLRLKDRLGLAEHGGRVQGGAPGGGEQLRRLQEDGGAVLPRPARPLAVGLRGRLHGLRHVVLRCPVPVGEHVAVVVGHHRLRLVPGANLLAPDDERDVEALRGHRLEAGLQLRLLGGAGGIGLHRLVDRRGQPPGAAETGIAHGYLA